MRLWVILSFLQMFFITPAASSIEFDEKFYTGWTVEGKCALWDKTTRSYLRDIDDTLCDSSRLSLPYQIRWDSNGRCGFYKETNPIKIVSDLHCNSDSFARIFTYQWSSQLKCQLYYRDKSIRQVEQHHCGTLPDTHLYGWNLLGQCAIFTNSSHNNRGESNFIRKVDDIYCDKLKQKAFYNWSVGGNCNLYFKDTDRDDKDEFVKGVPDWKCGDLHPTMEYAWTTSAQCYLFDEDDALRKVDSALCGQPSSNFEVKWTSSGECGVTKSGGRSNSLAHTSVEFCKSLSGFRFDWSTDGHCEIVNTETGAKIKTQHEQLCPGFPIEVRYMLDTNGHCHKWDTHSSYSTPRYISMAAAKKCENVTETKDVPATMRSYASFRETDPTTIKDLLNYLSDSDRESGDLHLLFDQPRRPGNNSSGTSHSGSYSGSGSSGSYSGGSSSSHYYVVPGGSSSSSSGTYGYPDYVNNGSSGVYYHSGSGYYTDPSTGATFTMPSGGSGSAIDSNGNLVTCAGGYCY